MCQVKAGDVIYIVCEMRFEEKTYGLNVLLALLVLNWNAIKPFIKAKFN